MDASEISIKCATQSLTSFDIQNIRIHTNIKHTCKYRVSQNLMALDLYSVSVNKILVTEFSTVKVLQNLNLM